MRKRRRQESRRGSSDPGHRFTADPGMEAKQIRRPCSEISYDMIKGLVPISVRCRILLAEHSRVNGTVSYHHTSPLFSRLFLFADGQGELTMEGRTRLLKPGTVYLLPQNCSFDVTYFPSMLYYFHLSVIDALGFHVFADCDDLLMLRDARLFRTLIEYYCADETEELESLLLHVVCRFLHPLIPQLIERAHRGQKYAQLIEYIRQSKTAGLTVTDLAEMIHMSYGSLLRDFERRFGFSLKTFLQNVTYEKATDLLAHTDLTVYQVAKKLGFNDPKYFHRFFKRRTGMTPRTYRLFAHGQTMATDQG